MIYANSFNKTMLCTRLHFQKILDYFPTSKPSHTKHPNHTAPPPSPWQKKQLNEKGNNEIKREDSGQWTSNLHF